MTLTGAKRLSACSRAGDGIFLSADFVVPKLDDASDQLTSNGMIALIVAMVGGVLVTVLAMRMGVSGGPSIWVGAAGGVVVLAHLIGYGAWSVLRVQFNLAAAFPAPDA